MKIIFFIESKFLTTKLLLYYAVLLFLLKMALVPFYLILQETDFFADVTKSVLIATTNKERGSVALSRLEENPLLNEAAYLKAKDMLEKGYFDHNSPEGATPWYWFKEAGYSYERAGENLAIGFVDSEEVIRAWLDSPSHKQNLLNPEYRDIGIAVLTGDFRGQETTVVVQLLGAGSGSEPKREEIVLANIVPTLTPIPVPTLIPTPASTPAPTSVPSEEFKEDAPKNEVLSSEVAVNNILYFMAQRYYGIIQVITYSFLIFIILLLVFNIFLRVGIQWYLIMKMAFFALLLTSFILIDKSAIINLIPHQLGI